MAPESSGEIIGEVEEPAAAQGQQNFAGSLDTAESIMKME